MGTLLLGFVPLWVTVLESSPVSIQNVGYFRYWKELTVACESLNFGGEWGPLNNFPTNP